MYIGISDDRMKHILGVARQCYKIAKEKYRLSEDDSRKAFMLGYLHDVGYEFSLLNSDHPKESYKIILDMFNYKCPEILYHGNPNVKQDLFQAILNEVDLTVDSKGNIVSVQERLEDIKSRYSENASEYLYPLRLAKKLNLI